jgi:CRP-like cAMP-binding protein
VSNGDEVIEILAGLSLFADLTRPQLEEVAHTFEEQYFLEGQRVIRQGFVGSGFHVILDGDASVRIDGDERARLARGDFFGEMSILLEEPPSADIVPVRPLRCLVLAGSDLPEFLVSHPQVMLRMLRTEARRLRAAVRWPG